MVKKPFICKKCGHKFEIEVLEPEEAEERRIATQPVTCPKCHGPVERC